MSFQETLVSKKQKKTKKYSKCTNKTKLQKKQRLQPSASLIAITTTKRDLKLSQEYFKVKNCKIPQFSFFLIAIHINATSLRKWSNEHDISMKNYENTKNTTIYLNDYKYGLTISLAKIKT